MSGTLRLELGDGRKLEYRIRRSARAKSLRLKLSAREGLTVIAPEGLGEARVEELVRGRRDWLGTRLERFEAVRHLLGVAPAAPPAAFDLPALAETWRVEYRPTKATTVGARSELAGRVIVAGAIDDDERSKAALRRWLARRAKDALAPWLRSLAVEVGLRFDGISVKQQRTRWGSCSAGGAISLNAKLLFLKPAFVRYVMTHELCHTLEPNHGMRFWTLLRQFEPRTDSLHGEMRDAWKQVPLWAQVAARRNLESACLGEDCGI